MRKTSVISSTQPQTNITASQTIQAKPMISSNQVVNLVSVFEKLL